MIAQNCAVISRFIIIADLFSRLPLKFGITDILKSNYIFFM